MRLSIGQTAGISGILARAVVGPERGWRLAFLAGLILPGLAVARTGRQALTTGLGETPLWLLAISGLIVGLGTGIGNGCTSGHGICGLASFSRRSLLAVLTFMAVAAITVLVVRHGGWR